MNCNQHRDRLILGLYLICKEYLAVLWLDVQPLISVGISTRERAYNDIVIFVVSYLKKESVGKRQCY